MKPLTPKMQSVLAKLAKKDASYSVNLNTLNALATRGLCEVWMGSHWSGLHGVKITREGRWLADELARNATAR